MAHYHEESPVAPYPISVLVRSERYEFLSSPGMFSKDRLDNGTRLLLESAHLPEQGTVLDLGCGIGVVGILIKKWLPRATVVQSDVTDKAIVLTRKNAAKHNVETTVVKSDCYDSPELSSARFDAILTNPPRAAGKAVIEKMIVEALSHLNTGGSLQLVALTNKGGKSYEAIMQEAFGNVEIIARGSGFRVYKSLKQ